ncbi:helix-turn-helix transcriptional regulator, partial [Paenibacillus albidus]|uniref:helix-turn-helix transcriptional regulator n=1 Tax=Paenibacillus albidus TaxID=2041023 RepID=UPI001BED2961
MDVKKDAVLLKLLPVLDYIEKNIQYKVDMKEAAQIMNLDYFYFGKVFKKIMGKTFIEYVNYLSLAKS